MYEESQNVTNIVNSSPYQHQQPEEDIYQNVGARRTSREGYGQMSNGKIICNFVPSYFCCLVEKAS